MNRVIWLVEAQYDGLDAAIRAGKATGRAVADFNAIVALTKLWNAGAR